MVDIRNLWAILKAARSILSQHVKLQAFFNNIPKQKGKPETLVGPIFLHGYSCISSEGMITFGYGIQRGTSASES